MKNKVAPIVELILTGLETTCLSEGLDSDELIPVGDIVISIDGVTITSAISTIY